jgi:hypothetical protein
MDSVAKRSNNFRFNFDLVVAEIGRWPKITLLLLVVTTLMALLVPDARTERLNALDNTLLLAGSLSATLGMKAMLLLMIYPLVRNAPFPGSYLLTSFICFVPIFPIYIAWSRVADVAFHEAPTPPNVLFPGLLFAYVLFSVAFAAFLRVQHAIIMAQRDSLNATLAKLRSFLRRDKSSKPPS